MIAHVGNEQVQRAIVVVVRKNRAHRGRSIPIGSVGYALLDRDVGESAVVVVVIQIAFHLIVGDVDVRPAIIVVVAHGHSHSASSGIGDSGFFGNIGKRAVAIVVKQAVGIAFVIERAGECLRGVVRLPGVGIELQIIADEQVQAAIAVVIEKCGAHAKVIVLHASGFSDVRESAIAVVVIENRGVPVGDIDVVVAVVVVIAHGYAHGETFSRHAGLRGYIGECSVAIVAVKVICGVQTVGFGMIRDAVEITAA